MSTLNKPPQSVARRTNKSEPTPQYGEHDGTHCYRASTMRIIIPFGTIINSVLTTRITMLCISQSIWGNVGMLARNNIAGVLTAFGVTGLLLSPFILTPAVSASSSTARSISVAIAAGPQLRLLLGDETTGAARVATTKTSRNMICSQVFRLTFADVGLNCRGEAKIALND